MTSAPRVGSRGLEALRQVVSVRDLDVLRDVQRFRLLSSRQLSRLHFDPTPTGARTARRVLARLTQQRLLTPLQRRIGGLRAGSDGTVYALGPLGDRILNDDRPRRRVREVTDGFLHHTLAIAETYVRLKVADRGGLLRVLEVQTEPSCWRRTSGSLGSDWLKPDLLTVIHRGEDEVHSFVEVDLGSEHRPALLRKFRLYEQALRSGQEAHRRGLFPQVVWLVPDLTRATVLRELTRQSGITPQLHRVALDVNAVQALSSGGHS